MIIVESKKKKSKVCPECGKTLDKCTCKSCDESIKVNESIDKDNAQYVVKFSEPYKKDIKISATEDEYNKIRIERRYQGDQIDSIIRINEFNKMNESYPEVIKLDHKPTMKDIDKLDDRDSYIWYDDNGEEHKTISRSVLRKVQPIGELSLDQYLHESIEGDFEENIYYGVIYHNMRTAIHEIILFDNIEDAEAFTSDLEYVEDLEDETEYELMMDQLSNMPYREVVEIPRNWRYKLEDGYYKLDDGSKVKILNPTSEYELYW